MAQSIFGNGPKWLPQGQRSDPFGMGNGGLLGAQQGGWRGLLGNQDLALALLANSGYGPKRSFGEILGTSALQAKQMGQERSDADFKREYMKAQMEAMKTPKTANAPPSVQEYEYAKQSGFKGSFQDWIVAGGQSSRPSSVLEWEHYENLLKEDKQNGTNRAQAYLEMKRAPPFKVEAIQGAPTAIFGTPGGGIQTTPLSTPQREIDFVAKRKAAESEAGAIGTGTGQIQAGIQSKGANAKTVQGLLDIADPLIDNATGSLVGAGADKVAAAFGKSLSGAEAISQLQVLQAGLMLNMPRMEGPQSDRDVEMYRQAAASLGDPMVPNEQKKAAVRTIRAIQQQYADRAKQPFIIHPRGSKEDREATVNDINNLLDKYAPR